MNPRTKIGIAATMATLITAFGATFWIPDSGTPHRMRRVHRTPVDSHTLDQALRLTINWPRWHRELLDAKMVDAADREYPMNLQTVESRALVMLKHHDGRKARVEVTEYVPRKSLRVRADPPLSLDDGTRVWGWSVVLDQQTREIAQIEIAWDLQYPSLGERLLSNLGTSPWALSMLGMTAAPALTPDGALLARLGSPLPLIPFTQSQR